MVFGVVGVRGNLAWSLAEDRNRQDVGHAHIPIQTIQVCTVVFTDRQTLIFNRAIQIHAQVSKYNILWNHIYNISCISFHWSSASFLFAIVNGGWGDWKDWNDCDKDCGGGTKYRYRDCNNPRPDYGGQDCSGSPKSPGSPCNTQPCYGNIKNHS